MPVRTASNPSIYSSVALATTACVSLLLGDPSTKVNLVCPNKGGTALDLLVLAAQQTAEDQERPRNVVAQHPNTENISWLEREERDRAARVRAKIRERVAVRSKPKARLGDAMTMIAQQCRSREGVGASAIARAASGRLITVLIPPPLA